jgi:hypothetical protein
MNTSIIINNGKLYISILIAFIKDLPIAISEPSESSKNKIKIKNTSDNNGILYKLVIRKRRMIIGTYQKERVIIGKYQKRRK